MTLIEKIVAIGNRLSTFGQDSRTREVMRYAVESNPWFTEESILRSVQAIVSDMLQPAQLEKWLSHYPTKCAVSRNILVIMAGNIPAVGFADLLCVVASGHRALVKYSSKDTHLMEYIGGLFADYFDVEKYDGSQTVDGLLAMGSDATASALRVKYESTPMLIRSSRNSLAVLNGDESDAELEALCRDIVDYDGRGCRSVSYLLVPDGYDFGSLMKHLDRAEVSPKWSAVYRYVAALMQMSGGSFMDANSVILLESDSFPMNIATLHYSYYSNQDDVLQWLQTNDSRIQCVVGRGLNFPRVVDFGDAQHPGLMDYPDGIDTMLFLMSIK